MTKGFFRIVFGGTLITIIVCALAGCVSVPMEAEICDDTVAPDCAAPATVGVE